MFRWSCTGQIFQQFCTRYSVIKPVHPVICIMGSRGADQELEAGTFPSEIKLITDSLSISVLLERGITCNISKQFPKFI